MSDLRMEKDELVRRAQGYAISKLDLESAERKLEVAQNQVSACRKAKKQAEEHLCCLPLQFRTTVVLLDHPDDEEEQMVVVVKHKKHDRDGDLWDVQMVEVTAR